MLALSREIWEIILHRNNSLYKKKKKKKDLSKTSFSYMVVYKWIKVFRILLLWYVVLITKSAFSYLL